MMTDKEPKPDVWRTPWKPRTWNIVIIVASVIVVGGLIVGQSLGFPLF